MPTNTVQLDKNLRYVPLSDDKGQFGLLIAHTGNHVHYTIQVETRDELRAAIESFQERPVGTLA